jgi:hypothetical protein
MFTNEAFVEKKPGHLILDHRLNKFTHGVGQGCRAIVADISWITLFEEGVVKDVNQTGGRMLFSK